MGNDEGDADRGGPFAFDLFEVVLADPPPAQHLAGSKATVLGRSRDEDGTEAYALSYDDESETWMADGQQLSSTGERRRREAFYDGSSVRVDPDGEQLDD